MIGDHKQAQDKVVPTTEAQGRMVSHKQAQYKVVAHHPGTGSVATTLVLPGAGHGTWPI